MAAATPDGFESRAWRVEGIPTKAEKHGKKQFALVMKYRTSATHTSRFASTPFRSSDPRYARLWDSKDEALRPENVEPFRDFVQVPALAAPPDAAPRLMLRSARCRALISPHDITARASCSPESACAAYRAAAAWLRAWRWQRHQA